jgi:hypothetical protein
MQFDPVTFLGIGAVALAALALRRHLRGSSVAKVDDRSIADRKDVLRALKTRRKD